MTVSRIDQRKAAISTTCAITLSMMVVTPMMGMFLKPISADFGWGRAMMPTLIGVVAIVGAFSKPAVGWLADRFPLRPIVVAGFALYSLSLILLAFVKGAFQFAGAYLGLVLGGAVAGPIIFTKVLAANFTGRRGAAIAVFMGGTCAVSGAVVPPLVQQIIENDGWRLAFIALGCVEILLGIGAIMTLPSTANDSVHTNGDAKPASGMAMGQALRSRQLWFLLIGVALFNFAASSVRVHVFPLLTDMGVSGTNASLVLSASSLFGFFGLLAAGWLLDRIPTMWGGALFFFSGFIGIGLIALQMGFEITVLGVMFIGLGLGAELAVGSYFITRIFGLRSFGQIFGWMNFGMIVAMSSGPAIMGAAYDRFGNYDLALIGAFASICCSALLISLLGRYNYNTDGSSVEPGTGKSVTEMSPESAAS